jgi:hypothetical protein
MKNRSLLLAAISTGTLITSAAPSASQDVAVTGSLKTTDGNPVIGYPVVLEGGHGDQVVVITNMAGTFTAHGLEAGVYTVMLPSATELNRDITVPASKQRWWAQWLGMDSEVSQVVQAGEFELIPIEEPG